MNRIIQIAATVAALGPLAQGHATSTLVEPDGLGTQDFEQTDEEEE